MRAADGGALLAFDRGQRTFAAGPCFGSLSVSDTIDFTIR